MKTIAIIPARSGSKGLPNKNILPLNGKAMMLYSLEAARDSGLFSQVFLSTDSKEYQRIAQEAGFDVPFLRSSQTSGDQASSQSVILEVLAEFEKRGEHFEAFCLLQPTSPLRDAKDLNNSYNIFLEKEAHSVVSLCPMEHPLALCNTLPENQSLEGFIQKGTGRRQEEEASYRINGAIYWSRCDTYPEWGFYGPKSFAYVMSRENSVDVDEPFDFLLVKTILLARENDGLPATP